MAYEQKILRAAGRIDLAARVRQISRENVAAGYDIASFNTDGEPTYIEVKATKTDSTSFEITENERRTAKRYASRYWIYHVQRIEIKPHVLRYQNPVAMLAEGQLVSKVTAWRVFLGDVNDRVED